MEFGLQVGGMQVGALRELAQMAVEGGFTHLTVPDHFVLEQPGSGIEPGTPSLEAIAVLGALAASTRRAKIGGMVLCNRMPAASTMQRKRAS